MLSSQNIYICLCYIINNYVPPSFHSSTAIVATPAIINYYGQNKRKKNRRQIKETPKKPSDNSYSDRVKAETAL